MTPKWYTLTIPEVEKTLSTAKNGLSQQEAAKKLAKFGPNSLREEEHFSWLKLFLEQFTDLLIIILLLAVLISFFLGDTLEAIIILAIVFFSAILGFVQEFRSQKALSALKKMAVPLAHVLRAGQPTKIPSQEVVPGDIILLHLGDKIPADARVTQELDLEVSEAILTGESVSVVKVSTPLSHNQLPLAERFNMVYMGTIVTRGHGKAIVVATGIQTEFGKIANLLKEVKVEKTPLEKKLDRLGSSLAFGALLICALAAALGVVRGHPFLEMLIWGVSLAVAAVPEALPAVVTGSLSLGVWEMAKRKAIVKHLPAVETLGSIDIICSDKTGTLTHNEMTVKEIFVSDKTVFVEGVGYQPEGKFLLAKKPYRPNKDKELYKLLTIGLLCNDASLVFKSKDYFIDGDPTEGALIVAAAKQGINQKEWQQKYPRVEEIPFDMERKRMGTIHALDDHYELLVKGSPESVLAQCKYLQVNGYIKKLSVSEKERVLLQTQLMANKALRVLAFAFRKLDPKELNLKNHKSVNQILERDLTFVGLVGLIDPPRDEAAEAIKKCRLAGIKPIIITGDHALTTYAIGKNIGLFKSQDDIITEEQLDKLSYSRLLQIVDQKSYARISPEGKLRVVKALKQKGYVVAMTGDGVNDAPALKTADIGVAMGLAGTDVAKEASAMILADDNFATIVNAIQKGREIYDNIKKYLFFLLQSNIAEIIILAGGFLLGLPTILSAVQILWINLVTDGLPALALGLDPPTQDVMKRKPNSANASIFPKKTLLLMVVLVFNMVAVLLPQFYLTMQRSTLVQAQTMVFVTMVLLEMVNAYNSRSEQSLMKINPLNNKWLNLAVLSSVLATYTVVQVPWLSRLFGTQPLSLLSWFIALLLGCSALAFAEITKLVLK